MDIERITTTVFAGAVVRWKRRVSRDRCNMPITANTWIILFNFVKELHGDHFVRVYVLNKR